MLELYDFELSSCAQKVRHALAEKGIPWARRRVDLLTQENKTPEYRALNPNGVVPTIVDDGAVLIEADIINEYIDARFEGPSLRPRKALDRARMRLLFKRIEQIHLLYGMLWMNHVALPYWRTLPADDVDVILDRQPDEKSRARVEGWIASGFEDRRLEGARNALAGFFAWVDETLGEQPWMAGSEFSVADISLLPYVDTQLHVVTSLWRERHSNIADWLGRVRARPSYGEAVAGYDAAPEVLPVIEKESGGWGRPVLAA